MRTAFTPLTLLLLNFSLLPGQTVPTGPKENAQRTPAEQYRALLRKYNSAGAAIRKAETDQQRIAIVENFSKFANRFLDIAEKNPKDPIALKGLRQAVQVLASTDSAAQRCWDMNQTKFPVASKDHAVDRLINIVLRDHLRSEKLSVVCERMRYGYRLEFERCLSAVLKKNPHRKVQAITCLALAQFLYDRLRVLDLVKDRPEMVKHYDNYFGKDYLPILRRIGRDKLAKRIENLFERAAKYDDVEHPFGGTVAEKAKSELYDMRRLAIGKTPPDIVGKDQDGKQFKLSDYRGKVVLLYFWVEF